MVRFALLVALNQSMIIVKRLGDHIIINLHKYDNPMTKESFFFSFFQNKGHVSFLAESLSYKRSSFARYT